MHATEKKPRQAGIRSAQRRWRIAILGLAITTLTFSLGMWQIARAQFKHHLQTAYLTAQAAPALDLNQFLAAGSTSDLVARAKNGARFTAYGKWLDEYTIYLDNRPRPGLHGDGWSSAPPSMGYLVLTPFELVAQPGAAGPSTVLVVRGWIARPPAEGKAGSRTLPPIPSSPQPQTIMLESQSQFGNYLSLNAELEKPQGKLWTHFDLTAYQAQSKLQLLPFTVRQLADASALASAQDGLLRTWPTPDFGIQKHDGYAVQWFGIALVALIFSVVLWRRERPSISTNSETTQNHAS